MPVTVYISPSLTGRHFIHYTLQLIADNKEVEFIYQSDNKNADLQISESSSLGNGLCSTFYQYLTAEDFSSIRALAKGSYWFFAANGKKDPLASIFYLVNSLQEYGAVQYDQYGRFPYKDSLQSQQGTIQMNIVQKLIDDFCASYPILHNLALKRRKSKIFLTHDIDTVYGARNENGKYALNNSKWLDIPGLIWNHHAGTPDWLNMDKIIAIEKQYGYRSAFYWLVNKDKQNADYDLSDKGIRKQMAAVSASGADIGLHKSLRKDSPADEAKRLDRKIDGQRYHFLSFNLPTAWSDLEKAGIRIDTSLGFSEEFGYRNSYGLPYMPYNVSEKRVYKVLEVPLLIMDRTFFNQKKSVKEIEKQLLAWLDKNKYDSVITINFHNNFFDSLKYGGYQDLYITMLRYFKEEGMTSMLHTDLLREFYKPDFYNSGKI